nr:flagellin [Pleomorphomonas koreensis]
MPVISTNTAANSAVRYLNINASEQSSSLSKLASGSRITQASDDAAGLAISTRISSDVATLNQAATNSSHAVSVLQTADGGASNISDILERMKTLATESASGTVTDDERTYIDAEFQELTEQIDTIATGTRFNGASLLDGTSAFAASTGGTAIVVGSSSDDTINVSIASLTSADLGLVASSDTAAGMTLDADSIDQFSVDEGETVVFNLKTETGTATLTLTGGTGGTTFTGADLIAGLQGTTASEDGGTMAFDAGTSGLTVDGDDDSVTLKSSVEGSSSSISLSVDGTSTSDAVSNVSDIGIDVSTAKGMDAGESLNVKTQDAANAVLDKLDKAIDTVSAARASIGAQESRFEFSSESIATQVENLESANSAITDVDVASEEAKLASAEVKVQAAVAAASSANDMTQNLLKLLQ